MNARATLLSASLVPFTIASILGTARATPNVDQQQPIIDSSVAGMGLGGASERKLAQVVTAGLTGALTEVRLPISCSSGDLRIEIQGVTDAEPDGTILSSEIIPGASLSSTGTGFRSLALSAPVSFAAGSAYAIVLTATGSCGLFQGPGGDPYLGGNAFYDSRPNAPGWVRLTERLDLPFQTVVEANVFRSLRGNVSLSLGPRDSDDSFVAHFVFEPSGDGEDVDPVAQSLSLQVGPFTRIIAAGSFVDEGRGSFQFEGTVEGVRLKAVLRRLRRGRFSVRVDGSRANLDGIRIPMELKLAVGDQSGGVRLTTLSAGDPVSDVRRTRS